MSHRAHVPMSRIAAMSRMVVMSFIVSMWFIGSIALIMFMSVITLIAPHHVHGINVTPEPVKIGRLTPTGPSA
jgi:hypothetical protein